MDTACFLQFANRPLRFCTLGRRCAGQLGFPRVCAFKISLSTCQALSFHFNLQLSPCGMIRFRIMSVVSEILVRPVQSPDREHLVRMRKALWPDSSAEEHDLEVIAILEGRAALTMPLIILVAETSEGQVVGFLESICDRMLMAATPRVPSAISKDGTSNKIIGIVA